eukprot:scaffold32777_cov112-Isochrysis_galbana.AAC.3
MPARRSSARRAPGAELFGTAARLTRCAAPAAPRGPAAPATWVRTVRRCDCAVALLRARSA